MSYSNGRRLLNEIKASIIACGPVLCIPVGRPVEAILRPVSTNKDSLNSNDLGVLTQWRNRHVKSFLTEFEATESRTEKWLTEIVGPDETRILFMIDDIFGRTFGYMGLAFIDWDKKSAEVDAVVRGSDAVPGGMTKALRTMIKWAEGQLNLRNIKVRVRSDNNALDFYRKVGFKEVKRVSLSKVEESKMIRWVEDNSRSSGEPQLVYMEHVTEEWGHWTA